MQAVARMQFNMSFSQQPSFMYYQKSNNLYYIVLRVKKIPLELISGLMEGNYPSTGDIVFLRLKSDGLDMW